MTTARPVRAPASSELVHCLVSPQLPIDSMLETERVRGEGGREGIFHVIFFRGVKNLHRHYRAPMYMYIRCCYYPLRNQCPLSKSRSSLSISFPLIELESYLIRRLLSNHFSLLQNLKHEQLSTYHLFSVVLILCPLCQNQKLPK